MAVFCLLLNRKEGICVKDLINVFIEHGHTYEYSPVGDITVTGLCLLMFALLSQTYVHKNRQSRLMLLMLITTFASAASDLACQIAIAAEHQLLWLIHGFWMLHQISLVAILFLYIQYMREPLWIKSAKKYPFPIMTFIMTFAFVICDAILSYNKISFHISPEGYPHIGHSPFSILFILLIGPILYQLIHYRDRMIRQVFYGLLSSNLIMILILVIQSIFDQISFTSAAYCLPVLAIIFVFHSNPFDIETGTVSENFFYDELDENLEKNHSMFIISCTISGFFDTIKKSKELKAEYYHFLRNHIKNGVIYHFPGDRLVLAFSKDEGLEQEKNVESIIKNFKLSHAKFGLEYKMVFVETTPDILVTTDYIELIEFVEMSMPENTIYQVTENDIQRFYKSNYILHELENINLKKDMDDPRVLVYCQPVFNLSTSTYDTAEALMRLQLDEIGMVFPDQFIPLAEQHGLIHTLSLIILNKTCKAIRSLLEQNYEINRISVNFSTIDLRYDSFCEEVQNIISSNNIPFSKIAIEITEGRNDSDFDIMNEKVTQLQKLGIKFYLDDFGTGYSNFERIMEIPFDIIKFDRTMLIESSKSDSSFYMISTFAKMFDKLNYSVLFEGVEDDKDEKKCVGMRAKYLQGYKYSRPIPIAKLCSFLIKANELLEHTSSSAN